MSEKRKTDNLTMRIWLETIENIVGSNGLKSILNYAGLQKYIDSYPPENNEQDIPVEDTKTLYLSLFELFGEKGARGLQIRAGREFIRIAREKLPEVVNALEDKIRPLPELEKMRVGLEIFKESFEQHYTSTLDVPRIEIQEEDDYFLLIERDNPVSHASTSEKPMCFTYVGMLQYQMEVLTGHLHTVKEIECKAMGHPADVFKISKAIKGKD